MSDVRCQMSAQPPAKRTAGLIEKETDERRTSNVQHRIMNAARREPRGRTIDLKKTEHSDSLNIQFSIVNSQFRLDRV